MKVLTLPLVGGQDATFFIGTQNLVITPTGNPKVSLLIDGVHNNGGWQIAKTYDDLVKTLTRELT